MTKAARKSVVFISFATADREMAEAIFDRLNDIAGDVINFFFAPRSIQPGENWPVEIKRHLDEAECVLVLLSDAAMASRWVLYEAGVAHGRGVEVIPLAFGGFDVNRQVPPLSFHQAIVVAGVDQLGEMLRRIAKASGQTFRRSFKAADLTAIVRKITRPAPQLITRPLLTRPEIFVEATRLVTQCHDNSVVRGATSLVHPKDTGDQHVHAFMDALALRCGEAASASGQMKYDVVVGVHRDPRKRMSSGASDAIAELVRVFRQFHALKCLRIHESRHAWSMNLLLVDNKDAIFGFPEGGRSSRLQYGVRISGVHLVEPMVHWYESSLKKGTTRLNKRKFL